MKRQVVFLALIVSAIASPLAETATRAKKEVVATTTERGVGTGVTEKIAPSGGPPPACRLAYNGKFGIAAMNITNRRMDVVARPVSVPVQHQVKPALAPAETTPAAVKPSDEFGVLTMQKTSTHTRTVTVRRTVVGQEIKASVYMISQIGDGQIQAPTSHTLLDRTTFGAAAPPPAASTGRLVTQIGDGQIQAPKSAAAPAAASSKPAVAPPAAAPPAAAPPKASPPSAAAPPAAAPPKASPPSAAPPAAMDPMAGMDMSSKPAAAAAPFAFPGLGSAPEPAQEMSGMSGMSGMNMKEKRQNSPEEGTTLWACQTPGTLSLTLQDGVLKDDKGRTGYIASNYQFQ